MCGIVVARVGAGELSTYEVPRRVLFLGRTVKSMVQLRVFLNNLPVTFNGNSPMHDAM